MAKDTKIEWATATWNPWIGCSKVSPACDNCYAEQYANRFGDFNKIRRTSDATFYAPLKWKEPKRIFVCSLSDFFHENVPIGWFQEAITIMKKCPQHIFMLLTKRPENMVNRLLASNLSLPKNVWLGVTAENQEQADKRIPYLLNMPAALHFVSCEPLLGPVDLKLCEEDTNNPNNIYEDRRHYLNWVICGGESGPKARPMHPDWARSLRDQCAAARVPFLFKQWGEWISLCERDSDLEKKIPHGVVISGKFFFKASAMGKNTDGRRFKTGRLLDGVEHNGIPEVENEK